MASVHVTIPSMLATLVSGDRRFVVEAVDLAGVVGAIFERHPELRVHLLDEDGALRSHVSLFHNDRSVRALAGPVDDGDTVVVLQAVSGGAPAPRALPVRWQFPSGTAAEWTLQAAPSANNPQA